MDLAVGYISPAITLRSLLGQCGAPLTAEEVAVSFSINEINDFTSESVKAEAEVYADTKAVPVHPVCAVYHGGPLDYPKAVSKAIGDVVSKWELCFDQVQAGLEAERRKPKPPPERAPSEALDSDEEVYAQLTGHKIRHHRSRGGRPDGHVRAGTSGGTSGKKRKQDQVGTPDEEEFFCSVNESASKLVAHSSGLVKEMLADGSTPGLLAVLAGLSLVRNKIWFYNELIVGSRGKARPFSDTYKEISEMVEAVAEQVASYQMGLAATTVLHDSASQNWTNPKPFYEGERASHCVQMWWFHLQGLRHDLWNTLSPRVAASIFCKVFDHTLGILVVRYSKVSPTPRRMQQHRADITTILLAASEVLTSISGSTSQLFCVRKPAPFGNQVVWSVHAKCRILFSVLALVGAPLHALYKATMTFSSKPAKLATMNTSVNPAGNPEPPQEVQLQHVQMSSWMHFVRPGLFSALDPEGLEAECHLALLAKMVAGQPSPTWALLVQLLLSHDMLLAKKILLHFGAFVPQEFRPGDTSLPAAPNPALSMTNRSMRAGCQGYFCRKKCLGPADVQWPQAVGSGLINLIHRGRNRHSDPNLACLSEALADLFSRMSPACWEALGQGQIWNPRRPVWLQAVFHLLEPYVVPAVLELMRLVDSGKAWTLNHVGVTMKEVLAALSAAVPTVPAPVLHLCFVDVGPRLPAKVGPLAGSVFVQVAICTLYGIVGRLQNVMRAAKVGREKVDFIIAFGEALVNLGNPGGGGGGGNKSFQEELVELDKVGRVALQEAEEEVQEYRSQLTGDDGKARNFDLIVNDFSYLLAEQVAGDVLADEPGKFSMTALHR